MGMNKQELLDLMVENPVFAAVRSKDMIPRAANSDVKIVFMLYGAIGELEAQCRALHEAGKLCFLHVDLIDGLRPDAVGIRYIAERIRPAGIITTKGACVRMAHDVGLFAIQRVFLLDSAALKTGVQNILSCKPDLVEILPGVADKALALAKSQVNVPLIAGGLIYTKEDVIAALRSGAVAVSTSTPELWED